MSCRKIVVFTTSFHVALTVASTAARFDITRSVWARNVALHHLTRRRIDAICPAVNRKPFATTPCEYGPMAAGALSV